MNRRASRITLICSLAWSLSTAAQPSTVIPLPDHPRMDARSAVEARDRVQARDYGAACDSVKDDTRAIQKAIDHIAAAGGGVVGLPAGFCKTTAAIVVSRGTTLQGTGIGAGTGRGNSGGTVIRSAAAAGDVIVISSDEGVILRDFTIDAPGVAKAKGTAGIRIQGHGGSGSVNRRSRLSNVRILNMYDGIVWDSASDIVIHGAHIQDFSNIGIHSRQSGGTDSGHNVIDATVIWDLNVGTSKASVRYDKGGDLRVVNSKLLGSDYGFQVSLDDGETGTLLLTGNSFEEQKTSCVHIAQAVPGKNLGNVVLVGNQFSIVVPAAPRSNIAVQRGTARPGAPTWIKNISIVGNVFNNAHNAPAASISVLDGEGVTIAANVLNGNGKPNPTGIDVGGNVKTAKVVGNDVINMPAGRYSDTSIRFLAPSSIMYFSSGSTPVPGGSTVYLGMANAVTRESEALFYVPYGAKALNMLTHASSPPGASETFTYTLRVNQEDSELRSQASGASSNSEDKTHLAGIPAPSQPASAARVSLKVVTSANAAAQTHTVAVQIARED